MKKILYGIVGGLFVIILCAVLVFFGFEKKIPDNWVESQRETAKTSTFDDAAADAKYFKFSMESVTYTKDGNKTITTYNVKGSSELKDTSKGDNESYVVRVINYNEQGELASDVTTKYYVKDGVKYSQVTGQDPVEISDFSEIEEGKNMLKTFFYQNNGSLLATTIDMFDNHYEKVTQKGLNITFHLVEDNHEVNVTFNYAKNKIVKIEDITKHYTESVLDGKVTYVLEMN